MKSVILNTYKQLLASYTDSNNPEWQAVTIDNNNPMVEITDLFLGFTSVSDSNVLAKEADPDLPWSEDHFQERINGKPINPGKQYKNWPYYKVLNNDSLFRPDGKFSHNYMERYWCKGYKGIRYEYGDLNNVINTLKKNRYTRQAYLAVWHPEDQLGDGVRVPCTIGYWFKYNDGALDITYHIRSCDAVRHFRNDIYMTYRLLQHVSESINVKPGNMKMWIGSFHCFKSDLYNIKKYVWNSDK